MKFCKVFLPVALSCCFLLTACSNSSNEKYNLSPDEPVSLTFWHYYNGTLKASFDQLVSEFNETEGLNQGIIIDAKSLGSVDALISKVTEAASDASGQTDMPDIFSTYCDTAYSIDKTTPLTDLSRFFTDEELAEYYPSYIEEGYFDDEEQLKVFPIAKSTEALFINKTDWDVFANAEHISTDDLTTWEGLAKTAETYYEYSGGKAFFGRDALANYILAGCTQLGHPVFELDNGIFHLNLDKDTLRTIWNNYYIPYIKGYYLAEGRFASDDCKTGSILAYVGSTTSVTYFPTEVYADDTTHYPIDAMVLPVPNFEDTTPIAIQQGAGLAVIDKDDTTSYAASVFIKWFTEETRNTTFALNSGYLPVKTKADPLHTLQNTTSGNSTEASNLITDTIRVSLDEIKHSNVYYTRPFENGNAYRTVLENSLKEKAMQDKNSIDNMIALGTSRNDALATYTTDENFETWYNDTLAALEKISQ